jgi:hypothetical protein
VLSSGLPEVQLDGDAGEALEGFRRALEGLLGLEAAILRPLARVVDRDRKQRDLVYLLERLDPGAEPHVEARWIDPRELDPETAALVDDRRIPRKRAPWARPGWLGEASEWIESSLHGLRRPPTGRVEQVSAWPLSAVLRVPTGDGLVYFKATAALPLFVDEGRVMQGLARLFPRQVPNPLAVDGRRHWMLLDEFGPEVGWSAPPAERELVLGLFSLLQVSSAQHVDALLALGCIARRPAWLAHEIHELLKDDVALAGLDAAEIARLRALEPTMAALCSRLAEGPIPEALVHGDLHLANVARDGDGYVFFDWSDACVTHPFLDLVDVHREEDPAVRHGLRDAYLVPWSDFAVREQLLDVWELARPLSFLNQAVSYRHITKSIEPSSADDLDWALPHWLRLVLDADLARPA